MVSKCALRYITSYNLEMDKTLQILSTPIHIIIMNTHLKNQVIGPGVWNRHAKRSAKPHKIVDAVMRANV